MKQFACSNDIPAEYREQLDGSGNLLVDFNFLRFIEQADTLPCSFRYLAFPNGENLLAFFPGMLLDMGYDDFCSATAARGISLLRSFNKDFLRYPSLEFGSPVITGPSRFLADGLSRPTLRRIVLEILDDARKQGCRLVVFRDFEGPRSRFEETLEETGLFPLSNLPTTRLKIDFDSFEEYLARMSAARRRNIRRKRRLIAEKGIKRVVTNRLLERPETYRRLYEEVRKKVELPGRERLNENYFQSVAENLPENSKLIHYYRGDTLAAFVSLIHKGEVLFYLYIGMDYALAQEAALYFNAYYDQIELALAEGIRTIDAGMTTYELKRQHGFEIVPQRIYAWTDSPLLRRRLLFFFAKLPSIA